MAGADGFEPPVNGIKIRCLTNLATPPVLRQGIEPKSAAYESAALPLSYLNNIRKELTPLWRSDSLRYSREFLLSGRSPGERLDKRNWPPVFYELTGERSLFLLPPTGNSQEPSGSGFGRYSQVLPTDLRPVVILRPCWKGFQIPATPHLPLSAFNHGPQSVELGFTFHGAYTFPTNVVQISPHSG